MMLNRNRLADGEHRYLLQQTAPRRWGQVRLLIISLCVASIPMWLPYPYWNISVMLLLAIPIVRFYWLLQYRIMRSAAQLSQHDSMGEVPIVTEGRVSPGNVLFAQVRAILRFYSVPLVLTTLMIWSLSLILTNLKYFNDIHPNFGADGYGSAAFDLFQYVGVLQSGYALNTYFHQFNGVYLPYPGFEFAGTIPLAGILLFTCTIANSIISASFGLLLGSIQRARRWRAGLVFITIAIFLALYALRNTPNVYCHRDWMMPDACSAEMLFPMRALDSLQSITSSFVDGGVVMMTGIHLPTGRNADWEGYQWRHLLTTVITIGCQLGLSALFLWRSNVSARKKRIVWAFGDFDGRYFLWRYR